MASYIAIASVLANSIVSDIEAIIFSYSYS